MTETPAIFSEIEADIQANPVLLYMKGNKNMPMCGFSSAVVHILNQIGVPFEARNVLENPELREGIKLFTNWPTIPQLYIKGEFVGGCDIVKEMFASGELQQLLQEKNLLSAA